MSHQVLPRQPLSLCNTSGKCHTEQTSVLSTEQKNIMIVKLISCLCVKRSLFIDLFTDYCYLLIYLAMFIQSGHPPL